MLDQNFDIRRSNKAYIDSPEHYIVVLKGIVYLRILGQEGSYRVVTATAAEDDGNFSAFQNQSELMSAAIRCSGTIGTANRLKLDFHNRAYVEICTCEFLSDAHRLASMLFQELAGPACGAKLEPLQADA